MHLKSQLSMRSSFWKSILRILEKVEFCGQHIFLYCQKHSNPNDPNDPNSTRVDGLLKFHLKVVA